MYLAIAPLRLQRSHNFDLLIVPDVQNERTLKLVRQSLRDILRHKVQNKKRPDTLLVSGNTNAIANDIRTLFYPYYQTVGVKRETNLNFLGETFAVQKGIGHALYLRENTVLVSSEHTEVWVAIAYGDTLPQASANYLNIFAAEHYPWHRCQTDTGNAFTSGWQFSVSGTFMPQDAEFNPERELQQIEQLTKGFYTGKLIPLSVFCKETAITTVDKQLQVIYKNGQLWRLSPAMSEPEKVKQHDRLLWIARSISIKKEMKIG